MGLPQFRRFENPTKRRRRIVGSLDLDGLLFRNKTCPPVVSSVETHSFLRGNCQFPYWKLTGYYVLHVTLLRSKPDTSRLNPS